MADKFKMVRTASEKPEPIDFSSMYIDFSMKHRNVSMVKILEDVYIYRALGRSEYREIINDTRFEEIKKEELICSQCLLYPNPDDIDWDEMPAGVPSELVKCILADSYLDDLSRRKDLHEFYRAEMYDLDNQITCIINEAFPNIDIEEIETWDVEKTTKYLSRAEWKLHNLRGLQFVQPQGKYMGQEEEDNEEVQRVVQPPPEQAEKDNSKPTIRGGSREDKLTPEKLRAQQEFFAKFPEFAHDDIMEKGIDGMKQENVDPTPPALRPGW